MPWINKEFCDGCQICVDSCVAGAISMIEGVAFIDDDKCIRCGVCHNVCPNDAVRHDGERIPDEVAANLNWVKTLLSHEYYFDDIEKQRQLINRLQRYFLKNKKVAEKTMEEIEKLVV